MCGAKVVKTQSNCRSQSKAKNSRTRNQGKTGKNTCTYIYYETIVKLFTFHSKNLLEDLSNIKIFFLYIMSSIMENIFIDFSDLKTVAALILKDFNHFNFCPKNVPF